MGAGWSPELRSSWNQRGARPFHVFLAANDAGQRKNEEEQMKTKSLILTRASMALSLGTAQAGPRDTTGRAADYRGAAGRGCKIDRADRR
jgi:hypothetical protein